MSIARQWTSGGGGSLKNFGKLDERRGSRLSRKTRRTKRDGGGCLNRRTISIFGTHTLSDALVATSPGYRTLDTPLSVVI